MPLNGNAAYFSKALVDMEIAAVGRQECEPDWRSIVDKLQRGLPSEWQAGQGEWLIHRRATVRQQMPPNPLKHRSAYTFFLVSTATALKIAPFE
jgi:hypothetical protein